MPIVMKMDIQPSNPDVNAITQKTISINCGLNIKWVLGLQVIDMLHILLLECFEPTFLYLGQEHWIGLEVMHKMTNRPDRQMQLKVSLERFNGEKATNFYNIFKIGDKVGA